MLEGKFGPENPEVETESFRMALKEEIELIDDKSVITDILEALNISGVKKDEDLNTVKEFLQSNIRGASKSELFVIQNKIGEVKASRKK